MKANRLIEKIHYYLCYCYHEHLCDVDTEIFKRQSNVLYYTSKIYHKLRRCGKPKHVYFMSYILFIKWALDIEFYGITELAERFHINLFGSIFAYEIYYLSELGYDFRFLEFQNRSRRLCFS